MADAEEAFCFEPEEVALGLQTGGGVLGTSSEFSLDSRIWKLKVELLSCGWVAVGLSVAVCSLKGSRLHSGFVSGDSQLLFAERVFTGLASHPLLACTRSTAAFSFPNMVPAPKGSDGIRSVVINSSSWIR